jgi:serine/threonine protein kinase
VQRIARAPMSIDEALPIARQVADALETEHEQGIVHRDVKPANINVKADGTVVSGDAGVVSGFSRTRDAVVRSTNRGPAEAGHYRLPVAMPSSLARKAVPINCETSRRQTPVVCLLHAETINGAARSHVDAPTTQGRCGVDLLADIVHPQYLPLCSGLQYADLALDVRHEHLAVGGYR